MLDFSIRSAVAMGLLLATIAAAPSGVTTRDFRIETDQTNSNLNDGNFTMPHKVRFFRPGTDAVADRAKGNFKAGTVTLTGHVVLHDSGESPEVQQAGAAPGSGPSTLQCDQLDVDSKRKIYIATGNVVYDQGTRRMTSQTGRLDRGSHSLDLSGNVRLADGDQTMTAQAVHYDTLTKDVSTSGNPVIFNKPAPQASAGNGTTLPTPPPKSSPPKTTLPAQGSKTTLPTPGPKTTSPATGANPALASPAEHTTLPTPAGNTTLPTPAAKATP